MNWGNSWVNIGIADQGPRSGLEFPLPSFVWFLPKSLKAKIAAKNHRYKYFFVPSLILSRALPGLPDFLYRLGRTQSCLSPMAKSFVVSADYHGRLRHDDPGPGRIPPILPSRGALGRMWGFGKNGHRKEVFCAER